MTPINWIFIGLIVVMTIIGFFFLPFFEPKMKRPPKTTIPTIIKTHVLVLKTSISHNFNLQIY